MDLNKTFAIGNLTRDPELRYTQGGTALCKFGLAVNRKFPVGDEWKEDTTFFNVVVWGGTAESCGKYLSKGKKVHIEGRMTSSSWETDSGEKRSKMELTAERVIFLSKSASEEPASEDRNESAHHTPVENNVLDDDVPF